MSVSATESRVFEFVGGHLCLDFANTVGGQRGGITHEYVPGYGELLAWSRQANIISEERARELWLEAERRSVEAAAVVERAHIFREAIYRIFAALVAGVQPEEVDLEILNVELGKALIGGRIRPTEEGFDWEWPGNPQALDQVLGPIARSAAELLVSPERSLVRECASVVCSWLFVDNTKNHRRRWCTMTGCGNVAKVRKYRQRQREQEEIIQEIERA